MSPIKPAGVTPNVPKLSTNEALPMTCISHYLSVLNEDGRDWATLLANLDVSRALLSRALRKFHKLLHSPPLSQHQSKYLLLTDLLKDPLRPLILC